MQVRDCLRALGQSSRSPPPFKAASGGHWLCVCVCVYVRVLGECCVYGGSYMNGDQGVGVLVVLFARGLVG